MASPLANGLQIVVWAVSLVILSSLQLHLRTRMSSGVKHASQLIQIWRAYSALQFSFGLRLDFIFVCHLLLEVFSLSKISTTNKSYFYYSISHFVNGHNIFVHIMTFDLSFRRMRDDHGRHYIWAASFIFGLWLFGTLWGVNFCTSWSV